MKEGRTGVFFLSWPFIFRDFAADYTLWFRSPFNMKVLFIARPRMVRVAPSCRQTLRAIIWDWARLFRRRIWSPRPWGPVL